MRRSLLVLGAALALACDPHAGRCDRVFAEVCTHQVECDIVVDYAECVSEARSSQFCDPERSIDDLDLCIADARGATCVESTPSSCYAVLCSEASGCGPDVTFAP